PRAPSAGASPVPAPPGRARPAPRGAGRWRGSRRSRGQTSRSRVSNSSPFGVTSAVSIEYSGTSSQVEESVVSGSEAMITERGGSPAVISQSPSRLVYSPPIAYQRLTNGRSVSSISSSGGYQP